MKNYYTLFLCILFLNNILFSQEFQNENKKGDKIKQLRTIYYTEHLDLTVKEAEFFWPLYNEMDIKLKTLKKENKKIYESIYSSEKLPEKEIKNKIETIFKNQIQEIELKKEYFSKFEMVIGLKKAFKLMSIEKEFKQKLIKELKKRKEIKK